MRWASPRYRNTWNGNTSSCRVQRVRGNEDLTALITPHLCKACLLWHFVLRCPQTSLARFLYLPLMSCRKNQQLVLLFISESMVYSTWHTKSCSIWLRGSRHSQLSQNLISCTFLYADTQANQLSCVQLFFCNSGTFQLSFHHTCHTGCWVFLMINWQVMLRTKQAVYKQMNT